MAENRAIGKDNDLLWHLSSDLKRFKSITMGHPIIMGRNTYFSLPRKPLPGRRNIVLTHAPASLVEGAEVAASVAEVLHLVADEEMAYVIGGASVYEQLLPFVDILEITQVHATFDADVFFPIIDHSEFSLVQEAGPITDEQAALSYSYQTYHRRPHPQHP